MIRSWRTIFLILGTVVVLASLTYLGWLLYIKMNSRSESPLKAIPVNTALILKINNPHAFWKEVSQQNLIWKKLTLIPSLAKLDSGMNRFDSILKSDEKLMVMMRDHPLYLVMTVKGRDEPVWMFLIQLSGYEPSGVIKKFIETHFAGQASIATFPYGNSDLIRISFRGEKEPLYVAVGKGVFIASAYPDLVSKSLDQIMLNLPSVSSTGFRNVEAITGKKVNANLYINYRLLPPFLSKILKEGTNFEAEKQSRLADWSGLDMIVKRDEFLVNGFTTLSDTLSQYLSVFREQTPQRIEITKVLPGNTSSFIYIATEDPGRFYSRLTRFLGDRQGFIPSYPELTRLQNQYNLAIRDYFLPWTGREMASVSVAAAIPGYPDNEFAVFSMTDGLLADSLLMNLARMTGNRPDSVRYEGYTIRQLHLANIVPYLWGPFFSKIKGSCYVLGDGYLIFGNDVPSLKEYLKQMISENLLSKDRDFISFSENMPDNTNLFFYRNNAR
ncbi:MAG TPA: hypothetical protein VMC08_04355, partial [Bacteroidales bacterium]|nr:hypothetical protein [Bacteroidales bacterium]